MARKCNTTKYRKRKIRERQSSLARKARVQKEEAIYWSKRHAREAEEAKIRAADLRERKPLVQAMANILTKRICDLDPSYVGLLHLRSMFKMTSLWGINPWPAFPTKVDRRTLLE